MKITASHGIGFLAGVVVTALVIYLRGAAGAAQQEIGGLYTYSQGSSYHGVVTLSALADSEYRADMQVLAGACMGEITVFGKPDASGIIVMSPLDSDPMASKCRVTLIPSEGMKIKIDEEHCGYFHGVSCGFAAEYVKVGKMTYFSAIAEKPDMYPFEVLKLDDVNRVLVELLGAKFNLLRDRFDVSGGGSLDDEHYCADGLKKSSGGIDEAIFCLNHVDGTAQAAIMEDERVTFYGTGKPVAAIANWIRGRP